MACNELEFQIVEYVENTLPHTARAQVEAHLATCPDCRQFAQELRALDATFTAHVRVPQVSVDFTGRLQQRLQAEPVRMTEAQKAERKRQYQAEYEAGLAELKKHPFHWLVAGLNSLQYVAVGAGIALLAWLFWQFTPVVVEAYQAYFLANPALTLGYSIGFSALMVITGILYAFPREIRRYVLPT